jgi:DNA-directed RNA polymerase subunit RPC12/RpoP
MKVILTRTKYFTCSCLRCRDPLEFGMKLSALRCSGQNCNGDVVADSSESDDLKCTECGSTVSSERVG